MKVRVALEVELDENCKDWGVANDEELWKAMIEYYSKSPGELIEILCGAKKSKLEIENFITSEIVNL